jgi:hypothetical protein
MKKLMILSAVATIVISNAGAYELMSSSFWETTPNEYASTYLNKTFVKGMADTFDREMDSDDKTVRDAFSKRTLDAVLGAHAAMIKDVKNWKVKFGQISNGIDFMAIPMREKLEGKQTLNEYTTKLRKDAIDKSNGKIWASGMASLNLQAKYNEVADPESYRNMGGPSKSVQLNVEGVLPNTFAPEFITILSEARNLDVEMRVLEQMEKLETMSPDEVKTAVENFNKEHAGKSDSSHPIGECYGSLNSQKPYLMKATEIQKMGGIHGYDSLVRGDIAPKYSLITNGLEYLDLVAAHQKDIITPSEGRTSIYTGYQDSSYGKFIHNYPTQESRPTVNIPSGKCLLPALKKMAPDVWGDYDPDSVTTGLTNLFRKVLQ